MERCRVMKQEVGDGLQRDTEAVDCRSTSVAPAGCHLLKNWLMRLTFFFSMFRAFFSMTPITCFKTSDCPQSDPGADPISGLTDCIVPFAFITEGI